MSDTEFELRLERGLPDRALDAEFNPLVVPTWVEVSGDAAWGPCLIHDTVTTQQCDTIKVCLRRSMAGEPVGVYIAQPLDTDRG